MLASEAVAQARESRDSLAHGGGLWNLGIARGELGRYEPARQALQADSTTARRQVNAIISFGC
jgi:hypothetical protein